MGILFQIKNDLLDVERNTAELGNVTHIDQQNQTVTYVSLLGIEKGQKRIEKKRQQAELILATLWPETGTIRDVIRHICERNNLSDKFISIFHKIFFLSITIYLLIQIKDKFDFVPRFESTEFS